MNAKGIVHPLTTRCTVRPAEDFKGRLGLGYLNNRTEACQEKNLRACGQNGLPNLEGLREVITSAPQTLSRLLLSVSLLSLTAPLALALQNSGRGATTNKGSRLDDT